MLTHLNHPLCRQTVLSQNRMTTRLSVAPMVGVTTRPHRYFCRLLSRSVTLYTEMVVAETVIYSKEPGLLQPYADGPVVLQLAGRNPLHVAQVVKQAEESGFTEVNFNCGCPSKKAAINGSFGAAMMKEPELVCEIVRTVKRMSQIPFTVKCRLGVDECDSFEYVSSFIQAIHLAGVDRIAIHARKGILGLNTKDNRSVPPLKYDWVYRLCEDFPQIQFDLNGGINTLEEASLRMKECSKLSGIMIGRGIWRDPLLLAKADEKWFNHDIVEGLPQTRRELLLAFIDHLDDDKTIPVADSIEALQGLFLGTRGSQAFRRTIAENRNADSIGHAITAAMAKVPSDVLDQNFRINKDELETRELPEIEKLVMGE
jgi:tRNA-dihydrouridine synthase A